MNNYKLDPNRRSYRKLGWNYGGDGAYFVTICTKNRRHFFGKGIQKEIALTLIGNIAKEFWSEIPNHYPYVRLGEYVVMPNHVHGIIIIDKTILGPHDCVYDAQTVGTHDCASANFQLNCKSDANSQSNSASNSEYRNRFGAQSQNLAAIIRAYKACVTRESRKINKRFAWQGRFHDRIIRNELEYRRIANYIIKNPKNWLRKYPSNNRLPKKSPHNH